MISGVPRTGGAGLLILVAIVSRFSGPSAFRSSAGPPEGASKSSARASEGTDNNELRELLMR